jgi:predicted  nucleic acid-binding Zn-ribbon protein
MEKINDLKNALLKQGSIKGLVDSIINDPNITTEDVATVLNESTILCENIVKVRKRLSAIHERYNNLIDKYTIESNEIRNKLNQLENNKNELTNSYTDGIKKQKDYNKNLCEIKEQVEELQDKINPKSVDDIIKNTQEFQEQQTTLTLELEKLNSDTLKINDQITLNKNNLNTLNINKQDISAKISQELSIYQNLANNLSNIQLLKEQISESFTALDNAIDELKIERDNTHSVRTSAKELHSTLEECEANVSNLQTQNTDLSMIVSNIQTNITSLEDQIKDYENKLLDLHNNHDLYTIVMSDNLKLLERARQDKDKVELEYNNALIDNTTALDTLDSLKQELIDVKNNYKQLEDSYNNSLTKSNDISKQISNCTMEISNILQKFNQQFTSMGLLVDKFNLEVIDMEAQLEGFQIPSEKN